MKKAIFAIALQLCFNSAQANVIQFFTGINYDNPAELFQTKDKTFIFGGTGVYLDAKFTGSQLDLSTLQNVTGVSKSTTRSLLPYGRVAKRYNDRIVIGIDVTQPFHSNLNWGTYSFTNYANTQNYLTDYDVSPKVSIALSKVLFAGAGVNFNFLDNNEVNWALPTGAGPNQYANMINKSSGSGVGFNLGLFGIINQQNMLGVTYYSKIKQVAKGTSFFSNMMNPNFMSKFYMPDTIVVHYLHFFNQQWVLSAKAYHTNWSVIPVANFVNTAAPPPVGPNFAFPLQFRDSAAFLVATHYQRNDKQGYMLGFMVDYGPEQDFLRPLSFPSDTRYFVAVGTDYKINESTKIELLYGHGFSNTTLNNRIQLGPMNLPFSVGKVNIDADVIDLKLKIEV